MNDLITSRVEAWYAKNGRQFSNLFDVFNFRLTFATDNKRGKATIEIDSNLAGANITFWNKGDVTALLLNKRTNEQQTLDDRQLTPSDNVDSLLDSYMCRIIERL